MNLSDKAKLVIDKLHSLLISVKQTSIEQAPHPNSLLDVEEEESCALTERESSSSDSTKCSELSLRNDILRAEIKSWKARDEANVIQLRKQEKMVEQLSVKLQQCQERLQAWERDKEKNVLRLEMGLKECTSSIATLSQEKELLSQLVERMQRFHDNHRDSLVLRDHYEQTVLTVKKQYNEICSFKGKEDFRKEALQRSGQLASQLQGQLFEAQQRIDSLEQSCQHYQRELSVLSSSHETSMAEVENIREKAQWAFIQVQRSELSARDSQSQAHLAIKMQREMLEKYDQLYLEFSKLKAGMEEKELREAESQTDAHQSVTPLSIATTDSQSKAQLEASGAMQLDTYQYDRSTPKDDYRSKQNRFANEPGEHQPPLKTPSTHAEGVAGALTQAVRRSPSTSQISLTLRYDPMS
eukprot:gene1357-1479_t